MSKLSIGRVLCFIGLVIMLASLGAGLFGLGNGSGLINKTQLLVAFIGFIVLANGIFMWVTKKDIPLKSPSGSRTSVLNIGPVIAAVGLVVMILALGVDLIRRSPTNHIGILQAKVVVSGFIVLAIGFFLWGTARDLPIKDIPSSFKHWFSPANTGQKLVIDSATFKRISTAFIILVLGLVTIFFYNNIYPRIDIKENKFQKLDYFHPASNGVGADYRVGIYRQTKLALENQDLYVAHTKISVYSNYPPFTHLFYMPLQLMTEDDGYLLIVFVLFITNIVVLGMMTVIIRDTLFSRLGLDHSLLTTVCLFLFLSVLFYLVTGYPYLFSIERGNYDIIAFFFAILSIFLLIKKPDSLWWQVLFLSMATNLKIYPAALFLILLLKHGKKLILPALVINVAMLFSLGFTNMIKFFQIMVTYAEGPDFWAGNHSGYSYAEFLAKLFPNLNSILPTLEIVLSLIPVLIWGVSIFFVIKHYKSELRAVLLLMVTVPLMLLLPSTSHDYSLVILSSALLILISMLVIRIYRSANFWSYAQLVILIGLMFLIDRSTYFFPASLQFISNKYPWVALLSILMLINVVPFAKMISKNNPGKAPTAPLPLQEQPGNPD